MECTLGDGFVAGPGGGDGVVFVITLRLLVGVGRKAFRNRGLRISPGRGGK